ncbi:MAG: DoxX family protein [Bacteroidales bacterium]|jgi:uncharacterized membrane protein YphA (DoxX/SURF4 family)|nr:DoxX family protein [Bacteroidales bacterium]
MSQILKTILRIAIGGMFITTAIMKLLSLDEFELYIYSFGIFNYLWCTFFARVLVAFEFILGFFLIIKYYYRYTWWLAMATMAGFTLFLIYVAIFRNDSNCHCFGDFVELNPVNSIIKNLITIILLLLVRKDTDWKFRFKYLVVAIYLVAVTMVSFVIFPMDAVYNQFKSPVKEVNVPVFEKIQTDSAFTALLDAGKYIVPVFIPTCKYCKMSMKKLNSIVENNDIGKARISIFIAGTEEYIAGFEAETETEGYTFSLVDPHDLVALVSGKFPTFIFVEHGKPIKALDFRGLTEKEVMEFLQ